MGCAGVSMQASRDYDDAEEADLGLDSPEAMADLLGEPDVWRHEGKGPDLRIVMIWNCLDGQRREVVWRQQVRGSGGRSYWSIVKDVSKDADCD